MERSSGQSADTGGAAFRAPPNSAPFRALLCVLRGLDHASYWIIVGVMAAMSVILAVQVVARYGLGTSIDASSELARLFFVWSIFLSIPHGIKRGVHVGIDVFVRMLPYSAQEVLFRAVAVAGVILMAVLFYFSMIATSDKWGELMPTLPVTAAVYYLAVNIACGHSLLHLAALVGGGPRTWEGEHP